MFITFEGIDGAGKTTQTKLLHNFLQEKKGCKVHHTYEPGGNEKLDQIRQLLRTNTWDPLTETLLLFAARNEHFTTVIQPKLDDGYIVLCDRFYDSTIVYQGILKGVDIEKIMQLKQMTIGDLEPDLTILLDITSKESIKRFKMKTGNDIGDEYDLLKLKNKQTIIDAYKQLGTIDTERIKIIKATNIDETHEKIKTLVLKKLDEKPLKKTT